jgi:hypothetical protein
MVVRRRALPATSDYLSRRVKNRTCLVLVLAVVALAGCSAIFGGDASSAGELSLPETADGTDEAVVADGRRYERRADGSLRGDPASWELPYVDRDGIVRAMDHRDAPPAVPSGRCASGSARAAR